jgi:hypothetical protein
LDFLGHYLIRRKPVKFLSEPEARHPEVNNYAAAVAWLKRLHIEEDAITDIAEWNNDGKRLWPA